MNAELRKHGAEVLSRVRASHRAACKNPGRRERLSEADQWKGYALAMARKHGIVPDDVRVTAYLNGRTVRFFSVRQYISGRWPETAFIGEWTIPDRVWTYSTTLDQIAAEEWTPVADQPELAECLA